MPPPPPARRPASRIALLGGLVMLVLLLQSGAGLFALWSSHRSEAAARAGMAELTLALEAARGAEVAFKVQVQEWKNILLRGHDPALRARHEAAFRAESNRLDGALRRLGPRAAPLLDDHAAVNAAYAAALGPADLTTLDGVRGTDAAVRGVDRALQASLEQLSESIAQAHAAAVLASEAAAQSGYEWLRLILNGTAAFGLLAMLGLLALLVRR